MSKIQCLCGNLIIDNTDFISNKAYFIADQDRLDFHAEIENQDFYTQGTSFNKYSQEIFQCPGCQNLIFLCQDERFDFQPVEKHEKPTVLRSKSGDKWKGVISANFYAEKGEIFWYTNVDGGFKQGLSIKELKKIYYEKFEELRKANLLRSAFLRINGETLHNFDIEKL